MKLPDTTLIAHNEHWLAGDLGNVAVIVDIPEDGRVPVASPTVVCCLPAVGMNAHGGGQGIGSLNAVDDGVGVPRVLVSRSSLESRSRADAIARAAMPGRAGGYGHVFAFADDAFTVETTGREHRVLDHDGPHTNHYLDPDLAALSPPPSEGSRARLTRLQELLEERRPATPEALMDLMRDHDSAPQADLPPPRAGRGRGGVGGDVLDGGRRGRQADVGHGREPMRVRIRPSRSRRSGYLTGGQHRDMARQRTSTIRPTAAHAIQTRPQPRVRPGDMAAVSWANADTERPGEATRS